MSAEILLYLLTIVLCVQCYFLFIWKGRTNNSGATKLEDEVRQLSLSLYNLQKDVSRQEVLLKEELRNSRHELSSTSKENREEIARRLNAFQSLLTETFNGFSALQTEQLKAGHNSQVQMRTSLDDCFKRFEETFERNVKSFNEVMKGKFDEVNHKQQSLIDATVLQLEKVASKLDQKLSEIGVKSEESHAGMRTSLNDSFKAFQETFDRNVQSFNNLQREKFSDLEKKQGELIQHTEQKLEKMRETVDEKLQKTLDVRLGQSFELVSKQLESVQRGLGEMQTLAQDVGGLKKVLSNVKTRGTLGEIQLGNILEQILAPDQYDSNVRTKNGSADCVEFAIKLPGRDEDFSTIYLPVDAKFPNDAYQQLLSAYDCGDNTLIETAAKNIEYSLKKMAKDIRDKYIDPPNTTDFAIMFLPTEGLYAEIIRRCDLMEQLQREYKIVVTGPTTLAAILNSLQMGFRTLAIQKRTGEVWRVLSAVKTEFQKFGGLLEKAQKNLQTASNQIDEVIGRRTRAIQKTLQNVEAMPVEDEVTKIIGSIEAEILDEEAG